MPRTAATEAHKAIREHDRMRRHERWAMKVMAWFVTHDWVSGFGLAGYGLAAEGYTDYPDIGPDEFRIRRTGAGPRTTQSADRGPGNIPREVS